MDRNRRKFPPEQYTPAGRRTERRAILRASYSWQLCAQWYAANRVLSGGSAILLVSDLYRNACLPSLLRHDRSIRRTERPRIRIEALSSCGCRCAVLGTKGHRQGYHASKAKAIEKPCCARGGGRDTPPRAETSFRTRIEYNSSRRVRRNILTEMKSYPATRGHQRNSKPRTPCETMIQDARNRSMNQQHGLFGAIGLPGNRRRFSDRTQMPQRGIWRCGVRERIAGLGIPHLTSRIRPRHFWCTPSRLCVAGWQSIQLVPPGSRPLGTPLRSPDCF